MPSCDVIVVNYNAGRLLSKCVNAVINSLQAVNVFVIDNASSDDSMEELASSSHLIIKLREANYGFAKSSNYGASLGNSEYICILNPDCIVEEDTLQSLIDEISANSKIGMLGCLITNPDGSEQRATRRRLPTLSRTILTATKLEKLSKFLPFLAGVNVAHKALPKRSIKVEAISGALMLVRRSLFEKLKGFDEDYPMHFEDLDLMKRVQNLGYEIQFNPFVSATHYQGESSKSNPDVNKMKRKGLELYFKKHGNWFSHGFVKFILKLVS